jgi:hypothetical protein
MLLSAVSVFVVAQSSSEIPKGLMNNPVYLFISLIYVFWAFVCPSPGENGCIHATHGLNQSNQQTSRHQHRVTNTSVAWIQQFSPDDGHANA